MKSYSRKLKRQLRDPKLLRERGKLVRVATRDGFFDKDVAEIFRITPSNIVAIKKDTNRLNRVGKK